MFSNRGTKEGMSLSASKARCWSRWSQFLGKIGDSLRLEYSKGNVAWPRRCRIPTNWLQYMGKKWSWRMRGAVKQDHTEGNLRAQEWSCNSALGHEGHLIPQNLLQGVWGYSVGLTWCWRSSMGDRGGEGYKMSAAGLMHSIARTFVATWADSWSGGPRKLQTLW